MSILLYLYSRQSDPSYFTASVIRPHRSSDTSVCMQIRQAIEVLEDWMLKQDRVMPNSYVFTCMITVLGRAGYTQKAFSFFNKVKQIMV